MGEFRICVSVHSQMGKEGLGGEVYRLIIYTTLRGGFVIRNIACKMRK